MSAQQSSEADPPRAKRIAVVAIHGVGDHPPFATAREIGDLLSNLEYKPSTTQEAKHGAPPYPPRYSSFTEVTKRIDVRPVQVGKKAGLATDGFDWSNPDLERNTWGPMDAMEKAAFQRGVQPRSDDPDNAANSLDHLFMKGQIFKYKGEQPEDTYQYLRLEGKRLPSPVGPAHDKSTEMAAELRVEGKVGLLKPAPDTEEKVVHIYEMYWSDLSRTANAFTRIFAELYQLLFHLGSVSVNNVLAAAIHFHGGADRKTSEKWHTFSGAQRFAAAVLAWPIPILNLLMAAIVAVILLISLMRTKLSAQGEFVVLDILVALLAAAGSGYGLSKTARVPALLYPLPLLVFGGLALCEGVFATPWQQDTTEKMVAAIALALALGCVWLIVCAYDKRRPGSKAVALLIFGIVVVALVVTFSVGGLPVGGSQGVDCPAIAVCLNMFEVVLSFLGLAWLIFFAAVVGAHVTGLRAVWSIRDEQRDRVKASRTRWTAQLVLALSSILFLTLTVAIWTGIEKITVLSLPGQPCMAYRPASATLYRMAWERGLNGLLHAPRAVTMAQDAERFARSPPLVAEWADQMLTLSGIAVLPLLLIALLIAFLMAIWAIFPSVLGELNPPRSPSAEASEALGVWLDRGFRFLRWAGEILYWIIWMPGLALLVFNFALIDWIYTNAGIFANVIAIVGTVVAGAAIGVIGFSGRLKTLAGGLRPALRAMLDVDNWLREHPRDANPTARICGRYVSLLRHISAWRDSDPGKSAYDAMIVIAHSQGTVITADFLRYLDAEKKKAGSMKEYDSELEHFDKMPLYFFTMGCPLHQLYGLRFPYLYGWARNDIPREEIAPGKVPDIDEDDAPRPDRLGVERWINAYRSGDYVGRYLWRGGRGGYEWAPAATRYDQEWDPPAGKPEKVSADKAGTRIEFCIGPGAHTHYWDHTAELIAEVLDRLINNARAGILQIP